MIPAGDNPKEKIPLCGCANGQLLLFAMFWTVIWLLSLCGVTLGHIAVILLDLVMDGVHEHKRIHLLQRTILPGRHFGHNFLANFTDQLRGNLHVVKLFDLLGNIPLG